MLIEDLRDFLLTRTAVTAIAGQRIRPGALAQRDALPGIVLRVETQERMNDLSGEGGLVDAEVTVLAVSEDAVEAWRLAEAVRTNDTDPGTGLAGYTGAAGEGLLDSCVLESDEYDVVEKKEGSDEYWHIVASRYRVMFSEST